VRPSASSKSTTSSPFSSGSELANLATLPAASGVAEGSRVDPNHANLYQANPFPTSYSLPIVSAPGTHRYFFNSRACQAYHAAGTPVVINSVNIAN